VAIAKQSVEEDTYPETNSLSPSDIEFFIDEHPQANLSRLWQRLGIRRDTDPPNNAFPRCGNCKAQEFLYDLDGERGDEILLSIGDRLSEQYKYLLFKYTASGKNDWKLLGHVEAWGKYKAAQHLIFISDGKPWLIVESQGASGSGVSLYFQTLYQVSKHGLKEILSYPVGGYQAGYGERPSRNFDGKIVSCEIKRGGVTVTLEFTVEYSMWSISRDVPLFSKRQTLVMSRSLNGGESVIDRKRSGVSQQELETVYNIDSMTEEDFLHFNYVQLHKIAVGKDSERKHWLRNYLNRCTHSSERRQLLKLLAAG
jgi:hypothetical protein